MIDVLEKLNKYGNYVEEPTENFTEVDGVKIQLDGYEPDVLVEDITEISDEEWHSFRNGTKGAYHSGGSSAGNIIAGCTSFGSAYSEWQKKLGLYEEDMSDKKYILESGHILERLARLILACEYPNAHVYELNSMFQHKHYKYLIADCDGFIDFENEDGTVETCIVECKKTSKEVAYQKFGLGSKHPTIPENYRYQAVQYMAVTGLNRVIFVVIYGLGANDYFIYEVKRNLSEEAKLIKEVGNFMLNVETETEPARESLGIDLVQEELNRIGTLDKENEPLEFLGEDLLDYEGKDYKVKDLIDSYLDYQKQIEQKKEELKSIETKMANLEALFISNTQGQNFKLEGENALLRGEYKETSVRETMPVKAIRTAYPNIYKFLDEQKLVNRSTPKKSLKIKIS